MWGSFILIIAWQQTECIPSLMKGSGKESGDRPTSKLDEDFLQLNAGSWIIKTPTRLALDAVHSRLVPSIIQLVKPFIKISIKYLSLAGTFHNLIPFMTDNFHSRNIGSWQFYSNNSFCRKPHNQNDRSNTYVSSPPQKISTKQCSKELLDFSETLKSKWVEAVGFMGIWQ